MPFWLMKSEPDELSIHDLQRLGKARWDGVRNYQARNILRDEMRVGDPVLVYHSSSDPLCIAGLAKVVRAAYPDPTAFDRSDDHFDPASRPDAPTWVAVDLAHVETYRPPLERAALAKERALAGMLLLQRGSRLSVQPVTPAEFDTVCRLGRAAARRERQA